MTAEPNTPQTRQNDGARSPDCDDALSMRAIHREFPTTTEEPSGLDYFLSMQLQLDHYEAIQLKSHLAWIIS
jgi:hypothetical protein